MTAEGEGMAQMQVSQGDCVWGIGRVTPCPPDPEEDLEISEDVRFLTSPADLDSSGGRQSLTPPRIPLAKCGDGITHGAQRGAYAYPSGSHNGCFSYADNYVPVINNIPVLPQAQYFTEAAQPLQHCRGRHHANNIYNYMYLYSP